MAPSDADNLDKRRQIAEMIRRLPDQISNGPGLDLMLLQDLAGRQLAEAIARGALAGTKHQTLRKVIDPHMRNRQFAAIFATAGELLWPQGTSHAPGAFHCFTIYCRTVADAIEESAE